MLLTSDSLPCGSSHPGTAHAPVTSPHSSLNQAAGCGDTHKGESSPVGLRKSAYQHSIDAWAFVSGYLRSQHGGEIL